MAYNSKQNNYTCAYCGKITGRAGKINENGTGEEGNHISPFSCIEHLKSIIKNDESVNDTIKVDFPDTMGIGKPKDW